MVSDGLCREWESAGKSLTSGDKTPRKSYYLDTGPDSSFSIPVGWSGATQSVPLPVLVAASGWGSGKPRTRAEVGDSCRDDDRSAERNVPKAPWDASSEGCFRALPHPLGFAGEDSERRFQYWL